MRIALIIFLVFIIGCGSRELPKADNQKLLHYHNIEREKHNLTPFVMDEKLNQYAQKHSEWMGRRNWLSHSRISNLMPDYNTVGENIAWNQKDEKEVTESWMNSPGHRANILNKNFTKIGFGMAGNSRNQPYWTTVFAN